MDHAFLRAGLCLSERDLGVAGRDAADPGATQRFVDEARVVADRGGGLADLARPEPGSASSFGGLAGDLDDRRKYVPVGATDPAGGFAHVDWRYRGSDLP